MVSSLSRNRDISKTRNLESDGSKQALLGSIFKRINNLRGKGEYLGGKIIVSHHQFYRGQKREMFENNLRLPPLRLWP